MSHLHFSRYTVFATNDGEEGGNSWPLHVQNSGDSF